MIRAVPNAQWPWKLCELSLISGVVSALFIPLAVFNVLSATARIIKSLAS